MFLPSWMLELKTYSLLVCQIDVISPGCNNYSEYPDQIDLHIHYYTITRTVHSFSCYLKIDTSLMISLAMYFIHPHGVSRWIEFLSSCFRTKLFTQLLFDRSSLTLRFDIFSTNRALTVSTTAKKEQGSYGKDIMGNSPWTVRIINGRMLIRRGVCPARRFIYK